MDRDADDTGRRARPERRADDEGPRSGRLRSVTVTLRFPGESVHPVDAALAAWSDVTREALYYVDAFLDGTGLLVYRLTGDPEAVAAGLADRSDVVCHEVVDRSGDGFTLYVHVGPGEPAGTVMGLVSTHGLLVRTPLEFTATGLRATLVGVHDDLRAALEALPESLEYTVERVGPFAADTDGVLAGLTDRQYEVLRTAVEVGYYDVPKDGDRECIAAALDLSPSTVGRHLQKAEQHVITRLLDRTADDE